MTAPAVIQTVLFLVVLLALVKPLGWYMARVLKGEPCGLDRVLGPVERAIYRVAGVRADAEMTWRRYAAAVIAFSACGLFAVYGLQRAQAVLPLNTQSLGAVTPDSAFNTSVSFVTNTNWQGYGGETTMSYFTQMLGLGVQNFVSAATGIAVLAALIRGLSRRSMGTIGNFWVDLTRSTLYILLPLSIVLAVALVSQGVVQTFAPYREVGTLAGAPAGQVIPLGPAASQIAIKQLGTNGGGFFNVNSAHPLENPTPLSSFLQMVSILAIAAALCWTYGAMLGDRRQGWAILAAMTAIFIVFVAAGIWSEQAGNPRLTELGVDQSTASAPASPGGNMEGKEARFGIAGSSLWAAATTAASNGSVNAMHDSFTPLGGLVPLALVQLGEVIFGGVGSGLYGMLMFIILTVFVAGLMVGRTPEYLGKKIEPFEMKMACLAVLLPCALSLAGVAVAALWPGNDANIPNPGPHGFTEVLYAYTSAANNNGSAFAGYGANTPFNNTALGLCMFAARFWVMVPVLAIAGSMAAKRVSPPGPGTLPTHTPVFAIALICIIVIVGALTFLPALALGPVAEHLALGSR